VYVAPAKQIGTAKLSWWSVELVEGTSRVAEFRLPDAYLYSTSKSSGKVNRTGREIPLNTHISDAGRDRFAVLDGCLSCT